jgi:hypothetical protein
MEAIAVHSVHGRGAAYLEIVPNHAGVRVRPTELGKRALNPFWPIWLRQLLLEQTKTERGYGVEVSNRHVLVTSEASPEATTGTVHHIAAQLQPLKRAPLVREFVDPGSGGNIRWSIKERSRAIPWALILDNIELPKRVRLRANLWPKDYHDFTVGTVTLQRPQHFHVPLSQLAMMVELQVAQACHR